MTKTPAPTASCKLCGTTAVLQWSHIVPNWTYRRLIKGNPPGAPASPIRVEGAIAIASPDQDAEYMLCRACEEIIGKAESYVASVALQSDGTFPALANTVLVPAPTDPEWRVGDANKLNVDAITHFALSVIWRASVSKLYDGLSLGSNYEPLIGQYLLGNAALPPQVRLMVELMKPSNLPRVDRMVVAPESQRDGAFHVYQFCMFGIWFRVLVGAVLPKSIEPFSFPDTKRVLLSDGRRLVSSVVPRTKAATPKGRLAKK